jgi:hypothetical protein
MKAFRYRLKKDPDQGFCIQEYEEIKYKRNSQEKTGKNIFTIWHDPYEGGEANYEDWTSVDNEYPNVPKHCEWKSFNDAYQWIIDNYGEVKKIAEETHEITEYEE